MDGEVSLRDIYTEKLRRGDLSARRALDGPDVPPRVAYLLDWLDQVHGRSGVTMSGLAPLTYSTIRDWRKERGIPRLDPEEVDALLLLDAARLHPDTEPAPEPVTDAPPTRAWPAPKGVESHG